MKNKWQKGLTLAAVSLTLAGCLNNLEAENTKKPVVGPNQIVLLYKNRTVMSASKRATTSMITRYRCVIQGENSKQ